MENDSKEIKKRKDGRGCKPGERRGGRAKGTKNKTTMAVKEALIEAFDGLGGVPSLIKWGKDNQTEFYKLWQKVMPHEVNLGNKGEGGLLVKIVDDTRKDD